MAGLVRDVVDYLPGQTISLKNGETTKITKGTSVYVSGNRTVKRCVKNSRIIGIASEDIGASSYGGVVMCKPVVFMKISTVHTPRASDFVATRALAQEGYASYVAVGTTYGYTYAVATGVILDGTAVDTSYYAVVLL